MGVDWVKEVGRGKFGGGVGGGVWGWEFGGYMMEGALVGECGGGFLADA